MTNEQGSPEAGQSADLGQGSPEQGQSAVALPNEVPQQYIAQPTPATAPAVPQEQGLPQGQSAKPIQADAHELERLRNAQRIADQRLAENLRLQQELQQLQQQVPQTTQQERNPFDPTTQYEQWDEWRINKLLDKGISTYTNKLMSYAQEQQRAQFETQWQQAHPGVDINLVKEWGRLNGVNNLDHSLTLMNLPNTLQAAQAQYAQQAFNQFKQPQTQNVATPVKGGQQAGGTVQLSYEAMANEFAASNGRVYNQWSPQLQKAFDQETYRRAEGNRG